jgi:hypothetical protein
LTWISACVLIAGAAAFVLTYVLHNTTAQANPRVQGGPPAKIAKHVKPSKDATTVARQFLETAVARKNMHFAYTLVAAPLKAGISRKEWEKGNNQVIPYPVNNARTVHFDPINSTKSRLYIAMILSATKKSHLDAFTFFMDLRKIHGKWLVDYFEAENPYAGAKPGGGIGG